MTKLVWTSPTLQLTPTRSGTRIAVTIPEMALRHRAGELDYWNECRRAWRANERKGSAVWRKYRDLVESGRYHFADRKGKDPYGFAEALAALALQRQGFKCWTGVDLFGRRPVGSKMRRKNTEAVEEQLERDGFVLPRKLSRQAKNPDIVAYHSRRREWCFVEVKRKEKVQRGQIIGLAILHLLTGGSATIIRLVRDKNVVPKVYLTRFRLRARVRVRFTGVH